MRQVRIIDRVAVAAAFVVALGGCSGGGGSVSPENEGAASPEQAVEVFMSSATEAQRAKAVGEFTTADRAYERMANVFGTEEGSIRRSHSAEEVRSRMLVLSACMRPTVFRIITQPDPQAWQTKSTVVSVELTRGQQRLTLPFRVVLGRGERWFIQQIDVSNMTC
jgi:hypothetical protein